jgi:hypothetical protein
LLRGFGEVLAIKSAQYFAQAGESDKKLVFHGDLKEIAGQDDG